MRQYIIKIPEPLYLLGKQRQEEYKKRQAARIPALWECVFKAQGKKNNKEGWSLRF